MSAPESSTTEVSTLRLGYLLQLEQFCRRNVAERSKPHRELVTILANLDRVTEVPSSTGSDR